MQRKAWALTSDVVLGVEFIYKFLYDVNLKLVLRIVCNVCGDEGKLFKPVSDKILVLIKSIVL